MIAQFMKHWTSIWCITYMAGFINQNVYWNNYYKMAKKTLILNLNTSMPWRFLHQPCRRFQSLLPFIKCFINVCQLYEIISNVDYNNNAPNTNKCIFKYFQRKKKKVQSIMIKQKMKHATYKWLNNERVFT